ncbi:MAG TPA: hypothetical protein DEH05_15395, partial [Propionibacteriaceae bacterium]|nr:hypothetical protein [Propionibacteriaceae bacterium]
GIDAAWNVTVVDVDHWFSVLRTLADSVAVSAASTWTVLEVVFPRGSTVAKITPADEISRAAYSRPLVLGSSVQERVTCDLEELGGGSWRTESEVGAGGGPKGRTAEEGVEVSDVPR